MGKDIDECNNPSTCGKKWCRNTLGSYKCYCEAGLEDDLNGGCKDIDECKGRSPCSANENCENNYGSFKCSCKPGFQLNQNGVCDNGCDLLRHPSDKTRYIEMINGFKVTRSCAPGAEFVPADCQCAGHVDNDK